MTNTQEAGARMAESGLRKKLKTALSREVFDGILQSDSYGFHTALEFFALAAGCRRIDADPLPRTKAVAPLHISHDYARRLAWGNAKIDPDPSLCFSDDIAPSSLRAIKDLLRDIGVPVPGRRLPPTWNNSHFLPYGERLTHWDARQRGGHFGIERIYMRGAGALAFKILRLDPDITRHATTRDHFAELLRPKEDVLDRILHVFSTNDSMQPDTDKLPVDEIEKETPLRGDRHAERICSSVACILTHENAPGTTKIDALLHIIPLGVLALQLGRAKDYLDLSETDPVTGIVDCGFRASLLRTTSKRRLARCLKIIDDSLSAGFKQLTEPSSDATSPTKAARDQFRNYFSRTAAAIGLLNSNVGIRHFVLQEGLLESLVMASVPSGEEIPFGHFCSRLFDDWGLVVDRDSAYRAELLDNIDGAHFEDNSQLLSEKMSQLGFLHEYSDQTRMVRYGF